LPELYHLKGYLELSPVLIFGAFESEKAIWPLFHSLSYRDFGGTNQLDCDCNVYSSLLSVIDALSTGRAAICASPARVASVAFYPGGSYENHPIQDFTCCMYL